MQPYQLSGAWIIDDTYNGNLEGIGAGTRLLKDLDAKRKLYVTPGLVDQGEQTESVHNKVGQLIAESQPDVVVLMRNSVTEYIKAGLKEGKFSGELRIEDNPLEFYTNLSHFIASGDLVVMQNDWTDNYA
jgi:UDP-N-acetylmuramoyl-tripeptide--D-alanyl-D-alanine ligase